MRREQLFCKETPRAVHSLFKGDEIRKAPERRVSFAEVDVEGWEAAGAQERATVLEDVADDPSARLLWAERDAIDAKGIDKTEHEAKVLSDDIKRMHSFLDFGDD